MFSDKECVLWTRFGFLSWFLFTLISWFCSQSRWSPCPGLFWRSWTFTSFRFGPLFRFNIWWDKHKGRRLKGRIHYLVFEPIREMGWRAPSAQFECGSDIIVKVRADWSLKDWASLSFTKEQQTNKWNKNIRDVSECIIELEIELASKCEVFREHRKHGSFKMNIQVGLFVVDAQLEGNPASKLVALAASN